jgi:hypothetical protein
MPDFEVYWQAGARAAHAGPLYSVTDSEYQFKYFPASAVLAIPIGALPLPVARGVWFAAAGGAHRRALVEREDIARAAQARGRAARRADRWPWQVLREGTCR